MDKRQSDLGFKMMALTFRIRDFFSPRDRVLEEVGIRQGWHILDYGCGPGGYVRDASRRTGPQGRVYALDIHPAAVAHVEQKGLANVTTIRSDCQTGLDDDSLDAVLLYDTYHDLDEPENVLDELHRVLRPGGVLSFSDHHLGEDAILAAFNSGRFELAEKGPKTYTFHANKNATVRG